MNAPSSWWLVLVVLLASGTVSARESMWHSGDEEYSVQERRYLLYDVNPGEGFNLRRDVYMRVANTVRQLRQRGSATSKGYSGLIRFRLQLHIGGSAVEGSVPLVAR